MHVPRLQRLVVARAQHQLPLFAQRDAVDARGHGAAACAQLRGQRAVVGSPEAHGAVVATGRGHEARGGKGDAVAATAVRALMLPKRRLLQSERPQVLMRAQQEV